MVERVLVTGARSPAAVDIARDFARLGYEVHMADCATARIARTSRAVSQVHRYPSPVRDPAGFRQRVAALVERLDPVLVVPSCEEVFHLAALSLGPRLFQPPAAMLRQLHDKAEFVRLCNSIDLLAPETHVIDGATDLERLDADPQGWVFKARFSRFGEDVLVAPGADRLLRVRRSSGRGWIAQRRVEGQEISFYAVARSGTITAFSVYASAWRLPGGASLTFDPVEPAVSSAAFGLASRLAAATELTGQFACDLIMDQHGAPWLIECNPRATSGAHLLVGDGRLARAMVATDSPPLLFQGEPQHLLPAYLTFGFALALQSGRLPQWWARLRAGQDVTGRPGDRRPMLGALVDGLGFMLTGARMGIGTTAATTVDIAWNGEDLA